MDDENEYITLPSLVTRQSAPITDDGEWSLEEEDNGLKREFPQDLAFIPIRAPAPIPSISIWKRNPRAVVVLCMVLKYNLINFLFTNGYTRIGALVVISSGLFVCYSLFQSLEGCCRRTQSAIFFVGIWFAFLVWQARKYFNLYHIFQYQQHFRMYLWEDSGELVDPALSTLMVLHMDASLSLLSLHVIYGLEIHEKGWYTDDKGVSVFHHIYDMALFYFILTLPIDFNRPRLGEHVMVHTLYSLNNLVVPAFVLVAISYKYSTSGFHNRYRYWFFFVLLVSHPVYELLMYSTLFKSIYM